ncbi:uncharacterized protein Tco025E_00270 [Trypanosoma conorhini]|uniref:OTU domain-containing protein n=1 Tax=Trypanosoma conorhini TaxID=83891 RepID=A0A3R7LMA8_9TRYP|nr:uncharacterized protein Tco025E_00270 [Trypanosoma conorhini]RNF27468.1 hypothetical protein Tco025E_00270 [Trypanosoma conorhini]
MGGCFSAEPTTKAAAALQPVSQEEGERPSLTTEPPCNSIERRAESPLHFIAIQGVIPGVGPQSHQKESNNGSAAIDTSGEEKAGQAALSSAQRSTLTFCTKLNDLELGGDGPAADSNLDSRKYAFTPVVSVAPFAARDSRILTASMFRKLYGGSGGNAEEAEEAVKAAVKDQASTQRTASPNSGAISAVASNEDTNNPEPAQPHSTDGDKPKVSGKCETSSPSSVRPMSVGDLSQTIPPESLHAREAVETRQQEGASLSEPSPANSKSEKRWWSGLLRRDNKGRGSGSGSSNNEPIFVKEKEGKRKASKGNANDASKKAEMPKLSREQFINCGLQRLRQRLDDLKLVEHPLKNDGNCQFRALAHQLLGSEDLHELVRAHIVTYMKGVRDRFDCYFASKEEADEYYKSMLKDGIWGDELTLRAASDSLHVNIHLLSSEEQNFYITYRPGPDSHAPVFLVDVATIRQQRHRRGNGSPSPLTHASNIREGEGKRRKGGGGGPTNEAGGSSDGSNPTPGLTPVFTTLDSVAPKNNTKGGEDGDEDGVCLVDACALQRRLQRKLAKTPLRAAATPKVDVPANSGSSSFVAMEPPAVAPIGDSANSSAVDGAAGPSSAHRGCEGSSTGGNVQQSHWRTVSQEIARFCAVGAEKVEYSGEQYITLLLPFSTLPGKSADVAPQLGATSPFHNLVSATNPDDFPRTESASVLFSPRQGNSSGAEASGTCDAARQAAPGSTLSLESDASGAADVDLTRPGLEDDQTVYVFEELSEPIDVFLSYLSPVHYNALSLAVDRTSPNAENATPQPSKESSLGENAPVFATETALPFLKRVRSENVVPGLLRPAETELPCVGGSA